MDFTAAISHRHGRLPAINLAFDSAWKVLAERNRPARFATDNAMRAELGERLLALVLGGVTHPEDLRRQVLATFPPCLNLNWRRVATQPDYWANIDEHGISPPSR